MAKEKKSETKNKDKNVKPAKEKTFTPQETKFSSESVLLEPLTTEKAVRQIELENKIAFIVLRNATKEQIKKELEETFKTKVDSVNTQIRNNKKIAFIKLKPESPAIDIATKLGLM
jgi:ribosomal protein L23